MPRAIDSVLAQIGFSGEIVVIDDGSTDNTETVMRSYVKKYGIKYIMQENLGVSAARNRGIDAARYDYIAFLDSDDHWKKDKLAKQIRFLKSNPSYEICHTREYWLRRGQHLNQKKIHIPRNGNIFNHCLELCAVGMSTVLTTKKLLFRFGRFDEKMICCEDYDLWLRVSSKIPFLLLPEQLTVKEGGREDQLSYIHRIGMDKYRIYAIQKLLDSQTLSEEQHDLALQMFKRKCLIYGKGCEKHGKVIEAKKYLCLPDRYIVE